MASRICKLVASEAEKPALSVSVGIASYPNDANSIGNLLYAADRAMYAMKGNGNRTEQSSDASSAT
jgi:diguanylate cyclase (GGDEF)-like protein